MVHARYLLVPVLFLGALTPGLSVADPADTVAERPGALACVMVKAPLPESPGFTLLAEDTPLPACR